MSSQVSDFAQLQELVLLEEFKKCLPERIVVYLNEQKVASLAEAAVLADEFVLTHKSVFLSSVQRESPVSAENRRTRSPKVFRRNHSAAGENRECFLLLRTWPPHCSLPCVEEKRTVKR